MRKTKNRIVKKNEEIPVKPFHELFPYGVSWTVLNGKKTDTNYAYFSYEDQRDSYIKKTLKGKKGINKFKTKKREN